MKTLKLPKGSLRQQLQEKLSDVAYNPCGSYLFPNEATETALKIFREWLEQKRQELNTTKHFNQEQWEILTELLEELKQ